MIKRVLALAAAFMLPASAPAQALAGVSVEPAALKVAAAADTPAEESARASPQCPEGWTLRRKSVKKSGAYTCRAAPGTQAVKLACPADLSYFENGKKGLLGCRP